MSRAIRKEVASLTERSDENPWAALEFQSRLECRVWRGPDGMSDWVAYC